MLNMFYILSEKKTFFLREGSLLADMSDKKSSLFFLTPSLTSFPEPANVDLYHNLRPHFVEDLHEGVVDHERDRHVQAHPAHAGQRALVERPRALVSHNRSKL